MSPLSAANPPFDGALRREKFRAFDLAKNSTGRATMEVDFWGRPRPVYKNANLSVYSGQRCNARCAFCVEELRPASRGRNLAAQRATLDDDELYFARLEEALRVTHDLGPSVSVTGGEPSQDPRLPRILRTLKARGARKRTLTTNGSGLLQEREGCRVLDWLLDTGIQHLNISRAHPKDAENARLMGFSEAPTAKELALVSDEARRRGSRVRLSCVLVRGAIDDLAGMVRYLDYAAALGVDNVVFRRLMGVDRATTAPSSVVTFSDRKRVALDPLLEALSADARFTFQRQIVGYYYYVEVFRYGAIDVVLEEADLAQLEASKRASPGLVHELVFHPNGHLASTWQPWDDVLGPPNLG